MEAALTTDIDPIAQVRAAARESPFAPIDTFVKVTGGRQPAARLPPRHQEHASKRATAQARSAGRAF
jgi:hypothetical protein